EPLIDAKALGGLHDTLALLCKNTGELPPTAHAKIATLEQLFKTPTDRLDRLITNLRAAGEPAYALTRILRETNRAQVSLEPGIYWADALERQVAAWNSIIDRYLLWAVSLTEITEENLRALGEAAVEGRREALRRSPSIQQLANGEVPIITTLATLRSESNVLPEPLAGWTKDFSERASRARWLGGEMLATADSVCDCCDTFADEMNLRFLFDERRKLFTIGFNVNDRRLDASYYDLLASECRLASFASIARGEVPAEHWLKLRRLYSGGGKHPALMSWSGTMFEYLMPLLLTYAYENSLLDYACRAAVIRQQEYGRKRGIPWGISEAAYSALDAQKTYQYHAFGVPGLGLKRGLEDDLVVAPYASALALQVLPLPALENLRRLEAAGMRGGYGFYESIDYTRQRVPEGERGVVVRNFMVHHQGMSLLAFNNVLHDNIMQHRFHADPRVQAASPLLYESIPVSPPLLDSAARDRDASKLEPIEATPSTESFSTADTPTPRVNLLSNGTYAVMTTNAGGSYSRWRDFDVTRWRADTTRDGYGQFLYLRDIDDNTIWSNAFQPINSLDKNYNVTFAPDKTSYRRRDVEIETLTEVIVSPEDDAEIHRVTLTNRSKRERRIELTSYVELALAPHAADRAHPAFSKLFVQTEAVVERNALLASRRLRSPKDTPVWGMHLLVVHPSANGNAVVETGTLQLETDRARFLGRGNDYNNPVSLHTELSGTTGPVLDPVFSLRRCVVIEPGQQVQVTFVTGAAESRERALAMVEKYNDIHPIARAFELAWTHAHLEMHRLRIEPEEVMTYQHLAGYMLYPSLQLRAPVRRLAQNQRGQPLLWAYGISGDLPIVVVSISNTRDVVLVEQVLQAHTFWRSRGLKCDLVILDEDAASYEQSLSDQLKRLVQSNTQYTGI
ncbi:MAG TPA: glucoamylase family protein, partial [Abditibacteriaceae bacterium]